MSLPFKPLPRWIDVIILPLVNVALAFLLTGLLVFAIGANPLEAVRLMIAGALGSAGGIGYTLYYATNFIFTGLAVAIAFHAGLFNIGGEGQAYVAGLGAGLVMLAFDHALPGWALLPLGIAAAALAGAAWAFIPAYLQAYRGSHVVITTIMFNFIAAALMVYLMVNVLIAPGSMATESRAFAPAAQLPFLHDIVGALGFAMPSTPLNITFFLALLCCALVGLYIWRTPGGYELRAVGIAPRAAHYAGIRPARIIIAAMCFSGALAGFAGYNEVVGVHHRLLLDFVGGAGFTGIAVALMGRNHPLGILLASLLFGILYQGGAEVAFDMPSITRETIVAMQGLVILFSGALAYMNRPWVARLYFAIVALFRRFFSERPAA